MTDNLVIKETRKFKSNVDPLANTIYSNFKHLCSYPKLNHQLDEIKRLLKSPKMMCYLVYNKDNKIIAYMVGAIIQLNDGRIVFFINYLYVAYQYRSNGIGSLLMKKLKLKCVEMDIHYITLICDTEDQQVFDFYMVKGFVPDLTLRRYERHDIFTLYI